jgi:hypothetical protein
MKTRQLLPLLMLGMLIAFATGCKGQPQPHVTVITSTMVGLEAKPPMGDGQPNPSVSLAYKRAEMVLVPVCQVTEYSSSKDAQPAVTDSSVKKEQSENIRPQDQSDKTQRNEKPDTECPLKASEKADAYAVAGSFQMQHNWFGPLNIRQFITTGMAARHLIAPTFHVSGEVKTPGRYFYKEGLTIEQALALAGGTMGERGKIKATQVRKESSETRELGAKAAVLPGDIIVVEAAVAPPPQPSNH